jgi:hypothetical protein
MFGDARNHSGLDLTPERDDETRVRQLQQSLRRPDLDAAGTTIDRKHRSCHEASAGPAQELGKRQARREHPAGVRQPFVQPQALDEMRHAVDQCDPDAPELAGQPDRTHQPGIPGTEDDNIVTLSHDSLAPFECAGKGDTAISRFVTWRRQAPAPPVPRRAEIAIPSIVSPVRHRCTRAPLEALTRHSHLSPD